MMEDNILYQWKTSYYDGSSRKWLYGMLYLTNNNLRFYNDKELIDGNFRVCSALIPLDVISEVKKASSTFVYKSVVVVTKGAQHWFASLANRGSVFVTIEHFWRERLLSSGSSQVGETLRTSVGKELLQIALDSEKTLIETSRCLLQQGEQLDYTQGVMYDIHNDLDVAERLTSGLESWLGHWGGTSNYIISTEDLEVVDARGLPKVHEFPIVYSPGETVKETTLINQGYIRMSRDGLTILDEGQKPIQHYKPRDISQFRVISPWRMIIAKYQLGQPDITFSLGSSRMMEIITLLEPVHRSRFQYDEPPVDEYKFKSAVRCPQASSCQSGAHTQTSLADNPRDKQHIESTIALSCQPVREPHGLPELKQTQISHRSGADGQESGICAEEIDELSQMIGRMKSMALGVQQEQERQLDVIDKVTDSVDHANARLQRENKRVQKLL